MNNRPTHLTLVPPAPTVTDVAVQFFDILLSYEIAQEQADAEHCGPEHGDRLRSELVEFALTLGFDDDEVWDEMRRIEEEFEFDGPRPSGGLSLVA